MRWIPVGRGDYWILKLDEDYQTVLVGEPRRKYLWVLSPYSESEKEIIHEYLNYAKSLGYDIPDVIYLNIAKLRYTDFTFKPCLHGFLFLYI